MRRPPHSKHSLPIVGSRRPSRLTDSAHTRQPACQTQLAVRRTESRRGLVSVARDRGCTRMSVPSHGTAEHPLRPSLSRSRDGHRAGSSAHPHRRSQRASGTCGTNRRSRQPYGRPRSSSQFLPNSLSDLHRVLTEQRTLCLRQLAKMDEARHLSSDPARREADATPRDGANVGAQRDPGRLAANPTGCRSGRRLGGTRNGGSSAFGGGANHAGEEGGQ